MKKFFQYLLIIALFSFWGIIITNKESFREGFKQIRRQYIEKPCTKPITFSVGTIDSKFNISQENLLSLINEAEKVWEIPMGKELFRHDQNSQFKINLIYDERQQETQEAKRMESQLNNLELSYDKANKEYTSLSEASKKELNDYNNAVADYEKKLDKYNREVNSWNQKGGAPENEYEKLKEEKKDLEKTYNDLEKQRKKVNALINETNSLAQKSSQLAKNYNSNLNTYKNRFGESREFDKGIYDGKSINIYQFKDSSDLRLVLAHEMGHALGIDHLSQPQSIMYYMMGEQDLDSLKASDEDVSVLKGICSL